MTQQLIETTLYDAQDARAKSSYDAGDDLPRATREGKAPVSQKLRGSYVDKRFSSVHDINRQFQLIKMNKLREDLGLPLLDLNKLYLAGVLPSIQQAKVQLAKERKERALDAANLDSPFKQVVPELHYVPESIPARVVVNRDVLSANSVKPVVVQQKRVLLVKKKKLRVRIIKYGVKLGVLTKNEAMFLNAHPKLKQQWAADHERYENSDGKDFASLFPKQRMSVGEPRGLQIPAPQFAEVVEALPKQPKTKKSVVSGAYWYSDEKKKSLEDAFLATQHIKMLKSLMKKKWISLSRDEREELTDPFNFNLIRTFSVSKANFLHRRYLKQLLKKDRSLEEDLILIHPANQEVLAEVRSERLIKQNSSRDLVEHGASHAKMPNLLRSKVPILRSEREKEVPVKDPVQVPTPAVALECGVKMHRLKFRLKRDGPNVNLKPHELQFLKEWPQQFFRIMETAPTETQTAVVCKLFDTPKFDKSFVEHGALDDDIDDFDLDCYLRESVIEELECLMTDVRVKSNNWSGTIDTSMMLKFAHDLRDLREHGKVKKTKKAVLIVPKAEVKSILRGRSSTKGPKNHSKSRSRSHSRSKSRGKGKKGSSKKSKSKQFGEDSKKEPNSAKNLRVAPTKVDSKSYSGSVTWIPTLDTQSENKVLLSQPMSMQFMGICDQLNTDGSQPNEPTYLNTLLHNYMWTNCQRMDVTIHGSLSDMTEGKLLLITSPHEITDANLQNFMDKRRTDKGWKFDIRELSAQQLMKGKLFKFPLNIIKGDRQLQGEHKVTPILSYFTLVQYTRFTVPPLGNTGASSSVDAQPTVFAQNVAVPIGKITIEADCGFEYLCGYLDDDAQLVERVNFPLTSHWVSSGTTIHGQGFGLKRGSAQLFILPPKVAEAVAVSVKEFGSQGLIPPINVVADLVTSFQGLTREITVNGDVIDPMSIGYITLLTTEIVPFILSTVFKIIEGNFIGAGIDILNEIFPDFMQMAFAGSGGIGALIARAVGTPTTATQKAKTIDFNNQAADGPPTGAGSLMNQLNNDVTTFNPFNNGGIEYIISALVGNLQNMLSNSVGYLTVSLLSLMGTLGLYPNWIVTNALDNPVNQVVSMDGFVTEVAGQDAILPLPITPVSTPSSTIVGVPTHFSNRGTTGFPTPLYQNFSGSMVRVPASSRLARGMAISGQGSMGNGTPFVQFGELKTWDIVSGARDICPGLIGIQPDWSNNTEDTSVAYVSSIFNQAPITYVDAANNAWIEWNVKFSYKLIGVSTDNGADFSDSSFDVATPMTAPLYGFDKVTTGVARGTVRIERNDPWYLDIQNWWANVAVDLEETVTQRAVVDPNTSRAILTIRHLPFEDIDFDMTSLLYIINVDF